MTRTRRQQALLATSGSPSPRTRSYAWATDSEHGFAEAVLLFDGEGRLMAVDYRRGGRAGEAPAAGVADPEPEPDPRPGSRNRPGCGRISDPAAAFSPPPSGVSTREGRDR